MCVITTHVGVAKHVGMPTERIPITALSLPLGSPPVDLVEEMVVSYVNWREDAAAVADAYARWSQAGIGEEAQSFAAYCAALDQEQSAAAGYERAVASLERAQWSADAASDSFIPADDLPGGGAS
jgi:hypothetical protein